MGKIARILNHLTTLQGLRVLRKVVFLGFPLVVLTGLIIWVAAVTPERPSIILISVDMLRADYFNAEYMPKTFGLFLERGKIYRRVHAPSTLTMTSHTSILSGLLPERHGANSNTDALPSHITILPERLKKYGYRTAAVVNSPILSGRYGWDTRFDTLTYRKGGGRSLELAGEELRELLRESSPFFLFAHTYTIRNCYNKLELPEGISFRDYLKQWSPDEAIEIRRSLYEERVREYEKRIFGFISDALRIAPDAIIILTSDHGEEFGDQFPEYTYHNQPPTSTQTHVPLGIIGCGTGENDDLIMNNALFSYILELAKGNRDARLESEDVTPQLAKDGWLWTGTVTDKSYTVTKSEYAGRAPEPVDKLDVDEELKAQLKALGYLDD